MFCAQLSHFGVIGQSRVTGLARSSSARIFKPASRGEMFGTLPHLPQGYPRWPDRCPSPRCLNKANSRTWLEWGGSHGVASSALPLSSF